MSSAWINAALGGLLIGLSSSIILLVHGRITGISGLLRRSIVERARDPSHWRGSFLIGLLMTGLVARLLGLQPEVATMKAELLGLAGFLVGFGTQLGSGCTSGHGVCGVSRASRRSFLAVFVFLSFGALTVYITRHILAIV